MDLSRLLLPIPLLAFSGACTTDTRPMPTPAPAPPPELMDATPLVDPATGLAVESNPYATRLYFAEGSDELTDVTAQAVRERPAPLTCQSYRLPVIWCASPMA